MLVAYKVVIPETGDKYSFDIDQYREAAARWHEEIAALDCDTYLIGVHGNDTGEEEQVLQWYLREYPAFSCLPNCSWCAKFGITRSRYQGISPTKATEAAKKRYFDWQEGRLVYPDLDEALERESP